MAKLLLMVTWTRWGKSVKDSDDQDGLVNSVLSPDGEVHLLPISLCDVFATPTRALPFTAIYADGAYNCPRSSESGFLGMKAIDVHD